MIKYIKQKVNLDAVGMATSVACAVHCAVLPLFFSSLPVFGFEILHGKIFEYSMIALAAVIGCSALYHGYKKHHHKKLPLFVFITGLLFLISKEIFVSAEIILLIPAAMLIISAHILNFKFSGKANHCAAEGSNHKEILS